MFRRFAIKVSLSSFIRCRWGHQLPSVATGENGAAGWRGGPGLWPSSPPPPSPPRPGRRRVRGRGAHVHHEWVGGSHGTLSRRCGVRRQLRLTFARLPHGHIARLQPETQETGEEDVKETLLEQRQWSLNSPLTYLGLMVTHSSCTASNSGCLYSSPHVEVMATV